MIIKFVRYNTICNEKLHLHVIVHAAEERSNSDRLISFKKTAAQASLIQHHNILQESILTVLLIWLLLENV